MKPVINSAINAGTEYANYLGFTDELFDGYLWDKGDGFIMISMIVSLSPQVGHFSQLINSLRAKGYGVKIPTPLGHMRQIVEYYGFRQTFEYDEQHETSVEVWVLTS